MNTISQSTSRSTSHRKNRKKSGLSLFWFVLVLFLISFGVWATQSQVHSFLGFGAETPHPPIVNQATVDTSSVALSSLTVGQSLVLVNSSHAAPDFADGVWPVSAFRRIAVSRADIELREITLTAAKAMFDAAKEDGFSDLVVTSGYRTFSRQKEIYDEAADKSYVQQAGESEHQTGLAVDIQLVQGGMKTLGTTPTGQWLRENAWKYGFVLRYPEDKEDITGISYESWHFRYVGFPHAAFMTQQGYCLEEYIDWLQQEHTYRMAVGDDVYEVYHQRAEGDIINVPVDSDFEISSDNDGGYIITAKVS